MGKGEDREEPPPGPPAPAEVPPPPPPPGESTGRTVPLASVVAVVIAAVLAGVGGYLIGSSHGSDDDQLADVQKQLDDANERLAETDTTQGDTETGEEVEAEDTDDSEDPPGSCDALGINSEELNEGTCTEGNQEIVVANEDSTLELDQLSAELIDVSEVSSLSPKYSQPLSPKGVFVVVRMAVTNETSAPQSFDSTGDLVSMLLCGDTYTENFNADNNDGLSTFVWNSDDLQPNQRRVGTAIFDVPESAADCVDRNGNVLLGNFRDDLGFSRPRQLGVFRTYN